MEKFVPVTYDQVIQKIQKQRPDVVPSVYFYECIEQRHIVPVFFLKSRVSRVTRKCQKSHARFSGWATTHEDDLHDLFKIGLPQDNNEKVTLKRVVLIQAIKKFEWEDLPDGFENWEIELKSPFWTWDIEAHAESETLNVCRSQVHFWLTDDSELNQSDATRTNTATVNEDNLTTQREPIYKQPDAQLLAILDTNHPDHAPDLAIAVKLWLDLYRRDEKTKHSHSHGADLFLGKEQLQSTAKERIKEITSPIKNWNKQRLGAYNNAKK